MQGDVHVVEGAAPGFHIEARNQRLQRRGHIHVAAVADLLSGNGFDLDAEFGQLLGEQLFKSLPRDFDFIQVVGGPGGTGGRAQSYRHGQGNCPTRRTPDALHV